MGRFDATKATIDANIKSNGNQEITGDILNSVMKDMVDATDAELTQLSAEINISDNAILNQYVAEIYAPSISSKDVNTISNFRIASLLTDGRYYNFIRLQGNDNSNIILFDENYATKEEALKAWSGVHWYEGNAFLLKGNPTDSLSYGNASVTFRKDFNESSTIMSQIALSALTDIQNTTQYLLDEIGKKANVQVISNNLFNPKDVLMNKMVNDNSVGTTQTLVDHTTLCAAVVPVEEGLYTFGGNGGIRTYSITDKNGIVLKTNTYVLQSVVQSVEMPSGAAYLWLSIYMGKEEGEQVNKGERKEYDQYKESIVADGKDLLAEFRSPLYGKVLACDGDSICYGAGYKGGYAKILAEKFSMPYENKGVGGGTIAAETYSGSTARHWICRSVATLREDADYILVEGGVNDPGNAVSMGSLTYGYNEELDDTTFYGAFESMLKTLITRFAGKKIGYIAVHKMTREFSSIKKNGENNYYHAAKECCDKWGVPFLDLNDEVPAFGMFPTDGELGEVRKAYTAPSSSNPNIGDGWHPNEEGYKKYYCDKIEAFMLSL